MKPSQIPDHTVYKVEDAPRLVELQKKLAVKGLKDPWIRNEVWRFTYGNLGTRSQIFTKLILPFSSAVVFVSLFVAFEKKYDIWKYDDQH